MCLFETIIAGRIVVVRTNRFGHTPIRHRQLGIEFRGMAEGACCLIVIEGVDESQSLIKEFLRLGIAGRDGMVQIAQAGHHGHWPRLSMIRVVLGRKSAAKQQGEQS